MGIIIHRVNTVEELKKIPLRFGVEIDIRETNSNLILNHEPFHSGDLLSEYLKAYVKDKHQGTIIFNIKEAGIETKVIELAQEYAIRNYFLLDVETPFLYAASRRGVRSMAVRYSEVEPIETLEYYRNYVDWIWIDTVSKLPLNKKIIQKLHGFKTCLVCPERWGRPGDIPEYKKKMESLKFEPTAVMTSLSCVPQWEHNNRL